MSSEIAVSASAQTRPKSKRVAAQVLERLLVIGANIRSAIGLGCLGVLFVGIVVALSCTIWAIEEGVAAPLAIVAGYCTFVTSACLCMVLQAVPDRADRKIQTIKQRQPNYAAWRLVATLRVADAARLWSGIEPGCPASQEAIAWAQAMIDAIRRGELAVY